MAEKKFNTLNPKATSEWNCKFTSIMGDSTELAGIIDQLSIYESIFTNAMHGIIQIHDGVGFVEANGIIGSGEEKVHFEIDTSMSTDALGKTANLEKEFAISYVTAGQRTDKHTAYQIGIVSPYVIANNKKKISRSFTKSTASDIVQYVSDKVLMFGTLGGDAKEWTTCKITKSKHPKEIVVPNWNPFHLINFLAKNSVSAEGESNYLFFENNEGFKFVTLDELLKGKSKREMILKDNPLKSSQSGDSEMNVNDAIMEDYSETQRFNIPNSQNNGHYGSSILTHNILEKKLTKYEVEYDGEKDKVLAEGIGLNGTPGKPFKDFNVDQHTGLMSDNYLYQIHDKGEKSHYPLHDMKMSQLRTNIVKFSMAGDTNIFAGDVITLKIASSIRDETVTEEEDQYSTGKWLITAIHHKINNHEYTMTLECMKDGFFTDPEITIPARG